MDLHLLLAQAGSGRPVLERPVPLESVLGEEPPAPLSKPTHLFDPAAEGDSLPKQRWALVVPEGKEGERLESILAPLLKLREEQQGAPVSVYHAPRGLDADSARTFRSRTMQPSSKPLHEQSRYVLLAGGLDAISQELQDDLTDDGSGYIGRLALDSDKSYEAYVDKVVRSERRTPGISKAQRAVFMSVKDGDVATDCGHDLLVTPVARLCQDERRYGRFPTSEPVVQETLRAGSSTRLLELARASGAGVFFTMSHGLGPPETGWQTAEEQRRWQGAMSLGGGVALTPEEVGSGAFMPGSIWFYFACFGAGTPLQSVYLPWMKHLARSGGMSERNLDTLLRTRPQEGQPFMTALTQAALANPDGPLAIIAHLDFAWSYAFHNAHTGSSHSGRFVGVLSSLVKGQRAGLALNLMSRYALQVDGALRRAYQADEETHLSGNGSKPNLVLRAHLWMERHDLMNYVLLGDPAARLTLGREGDRLAASHMATEPLGLAAGRLPQEDAMEDAVLAMISGASPYELAEKYSVTPELLHQWTGVYREAGRAALRKLREMT